LALAGANKLKVKTAHAAQGYYLARPVAVADLEDALSSVEMHLSSGCVTVS
jgi:hypothetical protein